MPPIVQQKSKQVNKTVQIQQREQNDRMSGTSFAMKNAAAPVHAATKNRAVSILQEQMQKLAEEARVSVLQAEKLLVEVQGLEPQIAAQKVAKGQEGQNQELEQLENRYEEKQEALRQEVSRVINTRSRQLEKQAELTREIMTRQNFQVTGEWQDRMNESVSNGYLQVIGFYAKEPWMKYLGDPEVLDKLRQEAERKLENARKRRALRAELDQKARSISDLAKVYQESGYAEGFDNASKEDLLTMYLDYADKLWDEQARKEYLSAGFITEHMVQCLSILEVDKQFQAKRKGIRLNADQKKRLKQADRIFQYYRHHVNTVLGDYGMSLDHLTYHKQTIEDLLNRKHISEQTYEWNRDYNDYQALTGHTIEEDKDGRTITAEERRLRRLERQAGISVGSSEEMTAKAFSQDTVGQLKGKEKQDVHSFVRLQKNILSTTADRRIAFSRETRLLAVSKVFVARLQQEQVWSADSLFNEIPKLLFKGIFSYEDDSEETYVKGQKMIRDELVLKLKQIITTSQAFQERQYASILLGYLIQEQDGDLVKRKQDQEIRVEDQSYVNMNVVFEKKNGKKCMDSFRSVKDEPLFAHDPVLKDIKQGAMGDCYFMSALASLVVRDPGAIKRMMKDNGDGTVTVRFFKKNEKSEYGEKADSLPGICVTVSKTIPERVDQDSKRRGDSYSKGALWVKMMEKAYAAIRDSDTGDVRIKKKSEKIEYENLRSGVFEEAIRHLTGEDVEYHLLTRKSRDVNTFAGRLNDQVPTFGHSKLKMPGKLYFYQQHERSSDKEEACRYLAGKKVSSELTARFGEELDRYQTIEGWLKISLEKQEGWMEIRAMDSYLLVEAIARQVSFLEQSIEKLKGCNGKMLENADLKNAGFGEIQYDEIRKCWEACGRDADQFRNTATGMLSIFAAEVMKDQKHNEYTPKEEETYELITRALKKGEPCYFGTLELKKKKNGEEGSAGEVGRDGMYGEHAYAILGAEEHQIGNRVKKFFLVFNPHGKGIPVYQFNEHHNLKRVSFKTTGEAEKQYSEATHGVFLLELRDMRSIAEDFTTGE